MADTPPIPEGRVLYSRYGGKCIACDRNIRVGVKIVSTGHGHWVHEECPDVSEKNMPWTAPAKTPLCPECNLYHRGDCF